MNASAATISGAVIVAAERTWARYQHRLALGHASRGHPDDALGAAQRAVAHFDRSGNASVELGTALNTLAGCFQQLGQLGPAIHARRRAVNILNRVAPNTSEGLAALIGLGDLHRLRGDYEQAEQVLNDAVEKATATQCDIAGMPSRAAALNALGVVYKDTGRYDAAAAAYRKALHLVTAATGPQHACSATIWHNLAGLAHAQQHPHHAEFLARRAVEIRERHLGPNHHLVAQDLAVLGATLLDQGHIDEAEALFERALTIFERRHPADEYEVAVNLSNLAACSVARGDPANAEQLLRHGLAIKRSLLGPDHPETARQLNNLAVAITQQHRPGEATDLHREALSILEQTLPADHPLAAVCRTNAIETRFAPHSDRHSPDPARAAHGLETHDRTRRTG